MTTQEFIQNFLNAVFNDFQKNSWCNINAFELNSDSYKILVNQQKYLIKYFAAYFCEYYSAYGDFFKNYDKDSLNIISVGCGSAIDYYALKFFLENNSIKSDLKYVGIDVVDWNYKPENNGEFLFLNKSLEELSGEDVKHADLIVFPKSLTELSINALKNFVNLLAENCESQKIYFLNSYITDNSDNPERVNGLVKFRSMSAALESKGFAPQTPANVYRKFKDNGPGLRRYFPFFVIPQDIVAFAGSLKQNCNDHDIADKDCIKCNVNFTPILLSKYLAFSVIEFSRV